MRTGWQVLCLAGLLVVLPGSSWGQGSTTSPPPEASQTAYPAKNTAKPGKEIGKGGEDIGVGVVKGTADLAKGTAGSVGNLAHGNFSGAGTSLGRGLLGLGKNVSVGSVKGFSKIGKGLGGELRKTRHKS